jgi:signal transduction histidine kinase
LRLKKGNGGIRRDMKALNEFMDKFPSMMMITDGNARVKRINNAMEKYTGVSRGAAAGMMCGDLICCANRLKSGPECGCGKECPDCGVRKAIEYTFKTGKPVENKEVEFSSKHPGGKIKRILLISTVRITTNRENSVLAAFDDITGRKSVETALKKNNKKLKELDSMKSNFISMASHELRTPIAIIKGYTAVIRQELERLGIDSVIGGYLDAIELNSKKLENITEDLLDSSLIRGCGPRLDKAPVDAVKVLRKCISTADEQAGRKNISIVEETETDCLIVEADEPRLSRAIGNLLDNAVKFSSEGSKVTAGISFINEKKFMLPDKSPIKAAGPYALIFVKDSGPGITGKDMEHIFDSFYQGDNSIKREHPGMGLGLSTARDIIMAHGGGLWVESRGKGKGAVFYIVLPAGERGNK